MPKLSDTSPVELRGVGPIRVGMSLAEASAAAGMPVVAKPGNGNCAFAEVQGGPAGLMFMVIDGRIARTDVFRAASLTTAAGVRVGDTEEKAQASYGQQLEVTERLYVPGHLPDVLCHRSCHRGYGVVFETDGTRVTSCRSGRFPRVGAPEGCS